MQKRSVRGDSLLGPGEAPESAGRRWGWDPKNPKLRFLEPETGSQADLVAENTAGSRWPRSLGFGEPGGGRYPEGSDLAHSWGCNSASFPRPQAKVSRPCGVDNCGSTGSHLSAEEHLETLVDRTCAQQF